MVEQRIPKKVCSRLGLGLFAMVLVWLIGATALQLVLPKWNYEFSQTGLGRWLANDIPLYLLGMPVYLLIVRGIPNGKEPERPKMKMTPLRYLTLFVFCLGAMYVFNMLGMLLTELIHLFTGGGMGLGLDEITAGTPVLVNLLFGAVKPALGEEFMFRYVLRRKMKGSGDLNYMLMSGLCFGLFHMNHIQGGYAFVVGITLAWVYVKTNSIWYSVSLHFLINALGLLVFPKLQENEAMAIFAGVLVLVLMGTAIALFFIYRKRVRGGLMPPSEQGWPYKAPYPLAGREGAAMLVPAPIGDGQPLMPSQAAQHPVDRFMSMASAAGAPPQQNSAQQAAREPAAADLLPAYQNMEGGRPPAYSNWGGAVPQGIERPAMGDRPGETGAAQNGTPEAARQGVYVGQQYPTQGQYYTQPGVSAQPYAGQQYPTQGQYYAQPGVSAQPYAGQQYPIQGQYYTQPGVSAQPYTGQQYTIQEQYYAQPGVSAQPYASQQYPIQGQYYTQPVPSAQPYAGQQYPIQGQYYTQPVPSAQPYAGQQYPIQGQYYAQPGVSAQPYAGQNPYTRYQQAAGMPGYPGQAMPPYQLPYQPSPYAGYPGQGYYSPQGLYPARKRPGFGKICLLNVGMILYIVTTGIMIVLTMFVI